MRFSWFRKTIRNNPDTNFAPGVQFAAIVYQNKSEVSALPSENSRIVIFVYMPHYVTM